MEKIVLEFSIDETNELLAILGKLPYIDSAKFISYIIANGKPQADAILAAQEQKKVDLGTE